MAVTTYPESIATHYDELGVDRTASAQQIRAAYRDRARLHHPDHAGAAADDAAVMSTLNEAYRVLSDPGRRAVYDRSLDRSTVAAGVPIVDDDVETPPVPTRPRDLVPPGPARVPWKLMLITAVVGSAAVLVGSAFNDPPSQEAPDGILRAGSCVEIEPNGDAREIACTDDGADVVVELLLPTGAECPVGLESHRDRLGLGTACIVVD